MPYVDPNVYAAQQRSSVFNALLERSMQSQTIRSPLQGLAGMGNTILSAYLANKGWGDTQAAQTNANEQRASHLKSAFGDQGNPVVDALMGNPDTADVGEQLMVANATRRNQRGFYDKATGRFLDAQGNVTHDYGAPPPPPVDPLKGIRQVGGQIVQVQPDGTVKPIYTAPATAGADGGAFKTLSADEVKALGLNPGTVAQRSKPGR